MVIVPKPNGCVRISGEFRQVNKEITPDKDPLPTYEEPSQFFAGCRFFSKIDLKWGYLQMNLVEDARYATAMITPKGLFQWTRVLFV